jgi:hypothetical protein
MTAPQGTGGRVNSPIVKLAVFVLIFTGCASRRTAPPPDWPQNWGARQIFDTPNAYVYATNSRAAQQVERRLGKVTAEFAGRSATNPPRGVIIVMHPGDSLPPGVSVREMFEAHHEFQKARSATKPAEDIEKELADMQKELDEVGLTIDDAFALSGVPLRVEQVRRWLELSDVAAAQVKWAALLPSDDMIRQINKRMLATAMKDPDMSFAERAAVTMMMPLMEPKMLDAIAAANGAVVFTQLAQCCTAWDEAHRQEEIRRYAAAHEAQFDEDDASTTSPASSD